MAGSNPFEFLKTTNDWLESVPLRVTNALDNYVGDGEKIAQSKVDAICTWLSWKINVAIERKRQTLLKILYAMYKNTVVGKVMQIANVIKEFVQDPLGAIGKFAATVFGPVTPVIQWGKTLIKEVPRLAENLSNIASSLPPTPPSPRINYDKFKIKVKTISMSTITSDPNNLPPPEVMYPEPPKPFTKETFANVFDNMSSKFKSNSIKYTLDKKDKDSIMSLDDTSLRNLSNRTV